MRRKHSPQFMQKFLFLIFSSFVLNALQAQDSTDLFKMLDNESKAEQTQKTTYATSVFKTTRLIDGQSIENIGKGILDVKISHRFGTLNSGAYQLFGLDNATMRMGVDYGLTNWLMAGIGRSTFQKEFDAFGKVRLLRQSSGKVNMPVSVSYVASVMLETLKSTDQSVKIHFGDRFAFAHQVLIARKFSDYISLQLMPTLVHYNRVADHTISNDLYSIGGGGRLRLSKRINLTAEYYYRFPGSKLPATYNSLSLGIDIETGGHVFQFHVTNSTGMTARTFIEETAGQWKKGDIHFGFNISRVFVLKKHKDISAVK